jgi:hypothetical protein
MQFPKMQSELEDQIIAGLRLFVPLFVLLFVPLFVPLFAVKWIAEAGCTVAERGQLEMKIEMNIEH